MSELLINGRQPKDWMRGAFDDLVGANRHKPLDEMMDLYLAPDYERVMIIADGPVEIADRAAFRYHAEYMREMDESLIPKFTFPYTIFDGRHLYSLHTLTGKLADGSTYVSEAQVICIIEDDKMKWGKEFMWYSRGGAYPWDSEFDHYTG